MLHQTQLWPVFQHAKFKYGYEIPNSVAKALERDKKAGKSLWKDVIALEMDQIKDYDTFHNFGRGAQPP